jgi:hypothetical protein
MINGVQHAGRAAKVSPIPIADDGDGVLADGSIVIGAEQAADLSALAQGSEKIAGDQLQPGSLGRARGASPADEHGFDAALRGDFGTAGQQRGGAVDDLGREHQIDLMRFDDPRDVELVRVGDRQRTQHQTVDQGKDRAAGADAQRERQDGDGREAGSAGEQPAAEPEVVQEIFERLQCAHVAAVILDEVEAAHVPRRLPPRIRRIRSALHRELLHLFEMKPQFFVELPVGGPAPHERAERHEQAAVEARRHGRQTVSSCVVTADERRRHWLASRSSWRRPARVSE